MKKTITREDFDKLSREWTVLDTEYDNLFQDFLDNPKVKTVEEVSEFQKKQKRLYAIEDELYKVADGTLEIKD